MSRQLLCGTICVALIALATSWPGKAPPALRAAAAAAADQPAPLVYPNNVNTLLQRDQFGDYQNVAYYDADSGLFLGPGADPRTTIYTNVPVNLFRRHVVIDFEEASGLDGRCRFHARGSATSQSEMGVFRIRTGATPNSRGELVMPNVSAPAYAGQRIYFYLRTYPAGNLRLSFGLRHPSREGVAILFSRTDAGGLAGPGGEYVSETLDGRGNGDGVGGGAGGATRTSLGVGAAPGGDAVRRLFCINVTKTRDKLNGRAGEVEFYVGTDGGVLERKAIHTSHIPDVTHSGKTQHLVPFVLVENTAAVQQQMDIDVIYGVLLR